MRIPTFVLVSLAAAALCGSPALASTLRVKSDAPGPTHDGSTWAFAYLKIGDALAASQPGDEVWVAAGNYNESLTLRAGRYLYGGFAGTESTLVLRNAAANVTILDGKAAGGAPVLITTSDAETATLDGFTIQNGYGCSVWTYLGCSEPLCRGGLYDGTHSGGGVYVMGGAPLISNNRIRNNDTTDEYEYYFMYDGIRMTAGSGGGIYVAGGSAVIAGNVFSGNKAQSGAGICISNAAAVISGNVFTDNVASCGGGVYVEGSLPVTIADNVFTANRSVSVYSVAATTVLRNRFTGGELGMEAITSYGGGTIAGNVISAASAGIRVGNRPVTILNNTISRSGGPGVLVDGEGTSGETVIANNIVVSNGGGIVGRGASLPRAVNNCVSGNGVYAPGSDYVEAATAGVNGNISSDPLFVDAAAADFHLLSASACIDGGDDAYAAAGDTDLDGHPRKQGAHVDIGCYEFVASITMRDAAEALGIAAGLSPTPTDALPRLDADIDNRIDMLDAVALARKAVGLDP
ncbi:MAG TPA: right-handed parallel beta-helix repeat-containing protein [Armatimonadota bacterium]|jgi:hypothetical protein